MRPHIYDKMSVPYTPNLSNALTEFQCTDHFHPDTNPNLKHTEGFES